MARMKFLCDTKRCIECNGCVTACKNENDDALEWGIQRRRVVTLNDGEPGETRSLLLVCTVQMRLVWRFVRLTVSSIQKTASYFTIKTCASAVVTACLLVRLALRSSRNKKRSVNVAKWTNVHSAQAVQTLNQVQKKNAKIYGANRIAEGKLPMCASLCSTKHYLRVTQRKSLIFSVNEW